MSWNIRLDSTPAEKVVEDVAEQKARLFADASPEVEAQITAAVKAVERLLPSVADPADALQVMISGHASPDHLIGDSISVHIERV